MFGCFFPRPQLFLLTAILWALASVLIWYFVAGDWSEPLGIADAIGREDREVWIYEFSLLSYAVFAAFWMWFSPHRWGMWSVVGTCIVLFAIWFQVQMDVLINEWFGGFYDLIQKALAEPGAVTLSEYYWELATFLFIAMPWMITAVLNEFFTSHYVFRWRTAMNDRYVGIWHDVRHIEGASQRVQEDTMRFAEIMEVLGSRFISSIMTLLAFLPILWVLSDNVSELPILGEIPKSLVWIAIIWSLFGTGLVAFAGIKLPGLHFRNQRVEAAFRKELVKGEDEAERAAPPTLAELFGNVRWNYFRLYFHYLYFNVVRFSYNQIGVIVPYIALGPTIVSAGVTLGLMQQIVRAFGKVEDSFQFLVHNWKTMVELMSIYKRLAAFERAIAGDEQAAIEFEAPTAPV